MKPIINPWWIYVAEKSNVIMTACMVIGIIAIVTAIGWYIVYLFEKEYGDNFARCPKWISKLGIVCLIIGLLTPSQKTVLSMMTINQITPNNIKIVGSTATDIVDYVTDKIEDIVTEQDKK